MEHHQPDIYGELFLAGNPGALNDIPVSQGAGAQVIYVPGATLLGALTTNTLAYVPATGLVTSTVNGVIATITIPQGGISADAGQILTLGSDFKVFLDAEAVQDAIGAAIIAGVGITYNDALNAISTAAGALAVTDTNSIDLSLTAGAFPLSADLIVNPAANNLLSVGGGGALAVVNVTNSVAGVGTVGSPLQLVNDAAAPGNSQYYGTNGAGVKGFFALPAFAETVFTGVNSNSVAWTAGGVNGHAPIANVVIDPAAANLLSVSGAGVLATIVRQFSVVGAGTAASPLQFENDLAAPGAKFYYGTHLTTGVKGWYSDAPRRFQASFPSAVSFVVNHNLNNGFPDVAVYRTDVAPPRQVQPSAIIANSANQVTVTLAVARPVTIEVQG